LYLRMEPDGGFEDAAVGVAVDVVGNRDNFVKCGFYVIIYKKIKLLVLLGLSTVVCGVRSSLYNHHYPKMT
jgi:hypothetical protein